MPWLLVTGCLALLAPVSQPLDSGHLGFSSRCLTKSLLLESSPAIAISPRPLSRWSFTRSVTPRQRGKCCASSCFPWATALSNSFAVASAYFSRALQLCVSGSFPHFLKLEYLRLSGLVASPIFDFYVSWLLSRINASTPTLAPTCLAYEYGRHRECDLTLADARGSLGPCSVGASVGRRRSSPFRSFNLSSLDWWLGAFNHRG